MIRRMTTITFALILAVGCERSQPARSSAQVPDDAHAGHDHGAVEIGPDTSPVAIDMSLGWCGGHGVPESVCSRCDSSLIARFKEADDWCSEHGLPETQCELCNPGVTARWAAVKDGGAPENDAVPEPRRTDRSA